MKSGRSVILRRSTSARSWAIPRRPRRLRSESLTKPSDSAFKEVAICECGTAYRVMKHMTGEHPFKVITFVELIERYLREGRIKLDKSKTKGRITYHDPCQIARNGGIYEEPRDILKHLTDDFVDMEPNRQANWCCGGGGGLVVIGEKDFRMKSAKVKADQVKATSRGDPLHRVRELPQPAFRPERTLQIGR